MGRIERRVQAWGVDHDWYEFAHAPRTALSLPVSDDPHNYPAIAVDGTGHLHVWANMHVDPIHHVVTTAAHDTEGWLSDSGWDGASSDLTGSRAEMTYPAPVHQPDGSLFVYARNGIANHAGGHSGRCDSYSWTRGPSDSSWSAQGMLFQGLAVPDVDGAGATGDDDSVDTLRNWSAYPTVPVVESDRCPNPGRMHMSWAWRQRANPGRPHLCPGYAYSDDAGQTWHAVDGTALARPMSPRNNHAARIPGYGYITSISRASNLVFATLDSQDHGIVEGNMVEVAVEDSSFDGRFTVSGLFGAQTLVWGQGGADVPDGGIGAVGIDDLLNWGGITVDDQGRPHMLVSNELMWWIRLDGSQWLQDTIPTNLHGVPRTSRANAFWLRGDLWALGTGWPAEARRQYLWNISGSGLVPMSGVVTRTSGWDPSADPEAYRRFGTVEVLACEGDTPRVFTFGNHARLRAAS